MNFKTTLIALLCPLFIFSQNLSEKKRDKIEAQKVAFITTELDLTSVESQSFWPIYNEFSEDMLEIHNQRKENNQQYSRKFRQIKH